MLLAADLFASDLFRLAWTDYARLSTPSLPCCRLRPPLYSLIALPSPLPTSPLPHRPVVASAHLSTSSSPCRRLCPPLHSLIALPSPPPTSLLPHRPAVASAHLPVCFRSCLCSSSWFVCVCSLLCVPGLLCFPGLLCELVHDHIAVTFSMCMITLVFVVSLLP